MSPFEDVHTKLLHWFEKHGRHDLPWRKTDNIYHIYLSEVMLQQTQVNRVMEEYYPKFLERFPTLAVLADASLEDVLSLWSGLGYYSRAKNLHECAKICQTTLPDDFKELQKLPGIGRYTASAICSFGYNKCLPVVDTNIKRVLIRLFALQNQSDKTIWEKAEAFLNHKHPKEHNLALMDLGSMICTPKAPKCDVCPLSDFCQGSERAEKLIQVKKKEYITMDLFFGINIQDGKIAMTPSKNGMYKGMLVLPQVDPIEENFLGSYKHSYTKYRLNVKLYKSDYIPEDVVWVDLEGFLEGHYPSLVKKAAKFF